AAADDGRIAGPDPGHHGGVLEHLVAGGGERPHPRRARRDRQASRRVHRGEDAELRHGGAHRKRAAPADGGSGGGGPRRARPDRGVESPAGGAGRKAIPTPRSRRQGARGRPSEPEQVHAARGDRPALHLLHAHLPQAPLLGEGPAGRRADRDGIREGEGSQEEVRGREGGGEEEGIAMVTMTADRLRQLRKIGIYAAIGLVVFTAALYLS